MPERFDDVLDQCLERLGQGETVEQCLARYPLHAVELEPLLKAAAVFREASAGIQPRPEFKARAGREIRARLGGQQRKAEATRTGFAGWMPRWAVAVATVILVFLIAGTGTVAASAGSMPDDTLYPVKLATEHVRVSLARGDISRAKVSLRLADRRVKEIVYLAEKGDGQRLADTVERLESHMAAIERIIEANADRPKVQAALTALKELIEERAAENELALEEATNNTGDPGILMRALERYRERYQSALRAGWRGSR